MGRMASVAFAACSRWQTVGSWGVLVGAVVVEVVVVAVTSDVVVLDVAADVLLLLGGACVVVRGAAVDVVVADVCAVAVWDGSTDAALVAVVPVDPMDVTVVATAAVVEVVPSEVVVCEAAVVVGVVNGIVVTFDGAVADVLSVVASDSEGVMASVVCEDAEGGNSCSVSVTFVSFAAVDDSVL